MLRRAGRRGMALACRPRTAGGVPARTAPALARGFVTPRQGGAPPDGGPRLKLLGWCRVHRNARATPAGHSAPAVVCPARPPPCAAPHGSVPTPLPSALAPSRAPFPCPRLSPRSSSAIL